MDLSRRDFLKATGIGSLAVALSGLGFEMKKVSAAAHTFKLKDASEFTSVCHFCACGCGVIGYLKDGKLIQLEGAVDNPINHGALCSKGLGYAVIPNSDQRATKPLYRAPGSDHWEEISWDEAIDKAARAMKNAREKGWKQTEEIDGQTYEVRRTDGLSFIGGSQINNEECYQNIKMARALGVVYIDNQTRVCHANTPPAMGAAFGRGAMTQSWENIKHTKLVWIEGSNLAECHPMGLKNVMKAVEENGAKIVHVDVRFTRTSKVADEFFQLRPGTDIAFMGYIIHEMLEKKKINMDYLLRNTNAAMLLRDDFKIEDGLFPGFDENKKAYTNKEAWGYALGPDGKPQRAADPFAPNTVLSRIKEFYSRYTLETVSDITGMSTEDIQRAADIWVNNDEPAIIMYALGMTQHTVGVQNIRCFTIMQLLKGNIGVSGGGIIAMRGQPNVQASTDFGIEFNMQPGYLTYPTHKTNTLEKWTEAYGTFRRKWYVNMTKAWFGEHATAENDFGFNYGGIRNGNHPDSIYAIFEDAYRGSMYALYLCGQNPHVSNANAGLVHDGLAKMDSLIVQDIFVNETAEFWNRPGDDPENIPTEVIFLPACSYLEREGSLTNSMRLIQWRMKGPDPLGDSKPDYLINDLLWKRIVELYKDSTDPKDDPIKYLTWNYSKDNYIEDVMKEISGYDVATGTVVNGIGELKDNGVTASGMWIYAGYIGRNGNMTKRRGQDDPGDQGIYPHFGWSWPDNIHILYNRASCKRDGSPADPQHPLVWWDAAAGKWTGYDVPDVGNRQQGPDTPNGQKPFRMTGEGVGRLFTAVYKDKNPDGTTRDASSCPVDGPLPEHYEPCESPTDNILHKSEKTQKNPCLKYPRLPEKQPVGTKADFPYILCSSSIAEHWCSGTVTRNIPWLNELVKENFIEIDEELADKLGISAGEKVKVSTARSDVTVKAMVTKRIHPLKINGEETHVVWMPYNFGFKGLSKGPSTNYITIDALDPNSESQEFKACLVNVTKA